MNEKPIRRYRIVYRSLFGTEFAEIEAAGADEAKARFWEERNPELYRIAYVECLGSNEERGDGADGSDEDRPADHPDTADESFAEEVFSSRGYVELIPVEDGFLWSSGAHCNPRGGGAYERVKHFLDLVFGKHH